MVSAALVIGFCVWAPHLNLPALEVNHGDALDLLGLLWQVEAGVLALTVTGALFAFESAARQRPTVELSEYAERSYLIHFVMLGASGLITIGIVIFWSRGRLPLAAASVATAISGLGILMFPAFSHRALKVLSPDWFRQQRLRDIHRSVERRVADQAFADVAASEFAKWSEERQSSGTVSTKWMPAGVPIEVSDARGGTVYDIDLRRLDALARSASEPLSIRVAIQGIYGPEEGLILCERPLEDHPSRPVVTMTKRRLTDDISRLVSVLHAESMTAIDAGSSLALGEVAEAYSHFLRSFSQAWSRHGAAGQGGTSMRAARGSSPVSAVQGDLWLQMERAVSSGLRESVLTLTRVLSFVAYEAIDLRDLQLWRDINGLATSFIRSRPAHAELQELVAEEVWRSQVEHSRRAAYELTSDENLVVVPAFWVEALEMCLDTLGGTLRALYDHGFTTHFEILDGYIRNLLDHWEPLEWRGDDDLTEAAPDSAAPVRRRLEIRTAGVRLSVLSHLVRRAVESSAESDWRTAVALARLMPQQDVLVLGLDQAMSYEGLLSKWIRYEMPENRVVHLDAETPALRAFLLVALLQRASALVPASWMTDARVNRLESLLDDLLADPPAFSELIPAGETSAQVRERTLLALREAHRSQLVLEAEQLAATPLDLVKVNQLTTGVIDAWNRHRSLPALLALTGASITTTPAEAFGETRLGFVPTLMSRGLFVTPSSWVGLDTNAADFGRRLAQGETAAVASEALEKGRGVRVKGTAADRILSVIERMRREGFEPSVLFIGSDWRLARQLGLERPTLDGSPLRSHLKGYIEGVPVISWSVVPPTRAVVLDLARFCEVEERANGDGAAAVPTVTLDEITVERAQELVAEWDGTTPSSVDPARVREVRTSVIVTVSRYFRVRVLDREAARCFSVGRRETAAP